MSVQQLCYYQPTRRSLIVANQGPDDIIISSQLGDVSRAVPVGITVLANRHIRMYYDRDGELVWQYWYASCTRSQVMVYESIASKYDASLTTVTHSHVRDVSATQRRLCLTTWWADRRHGCCNL